MANGFTTERMVELIYEEVKGIQVKIDAIQASVAEVNSRGCAQRPNDLSRLSSLENSREGFTSKLIALLFSVILTLCTALYGVFK